MKKIIFCLIIIIFLTFLSCNPKNELTQKEQFILLDACEQLGKDLGSIKITSNESLGNVETYTYIANIDKNDYFGSIVFYHNSKSKKFYDDNTKVLSSAYPLSTDKPFEIYQSAFATPEKYIKKGDPQTEYRLFYGNINNKDISRVAIELDNESFHIMVENDTYSLLTYNISLPNSIKGLNNDLEVIFDYDE